MVITRRRPDPDGIITAQLAGTVGRYVSRKPLDVEAAVTELREIANGRGDLLAERAGVILGFHDEDARDGRWPRPALEAALCIAAGADLTRLMEWIAVGQERSGKAALDEGGQVRIPASGGGRTDPSGGSCRARRRRARGSFRRRRVSL
jgi:hypothetical protein